MPEVGQVLACILSRMGHIVRTSDSCRNALILLKDFNPDVIFSDISMPEVDGYAFVRLLRERPDTQSKFVIAMTANSSTTERASLEAGFDAHLKKPFSFEAIHRVLCDTKTLRDCNL